MRERPQPLCSGLDQPSQCKRTSHAAATIMPQTKLFDAAVVVAPYFLVLLYVLLCPFNKVEESFHLQATHDVLIHGTDITSYDHHAFPGVVPRTFLGALFLAALAWPWKLLCAAIGAPKILLQVAVRATLGTCVVLSYTRLCDAVRARLGRRTALGMLLTACVTPHFLFYASRTLPNTFAVMLTLQAFREWVLMPPHASPPPTTATAWMSTLFPRNVAATLRDARLWRCVAWLVSAAVWLRCDMLVLLAPIGLTWLLQRQANVPQLLVMGVITATTALAMTVGVDSLLWRRLLWPEGEVLYFNAVLNRSHEYGISPRHWYFTSALPRALLGALVFIPAGLITLVPHRPQKAAASTHAGGGGNAGDASTAAAAPAGQVRPPRPLRVPLDTTPARLDDVFWQRYEHRSLLQLASRMRLDSDVAQFTLPAVVFILLYSALPHKELRFIMPGMPLFHIAAGRGLAKLWALGIALYAGMQRHRLGPEAAAAEFVADAVETIMSNSAPGVAELVGTPRAVLRQRHARFAERQAAGLATMSLGRASTSTNKAPPALPDTFRRPSSTLRKEVVATPQAGDQVARPPSPAGSEASASSGRWSPLDAGDADVLATPTPASAGPSSSVGKEAPPSVHHISPVRAALGLLTLALVLTCLGCSVAATAVFIRVSMYNYPGGEALQRLYTLYGNELRTRAAAEMHQRTLHAGDREARQPEHEWRAGAVSTSTRFTTPHAPASALPYVPTGTLLPCPEADVVGTGVVEWYRQCMDAKTGCPLVNASAGSIFPRMDGDAAGCYNPGMLVRGGATSTSGQRQRHAVRVHIDIASAVSGVSRFGEAWSTSGAWLYSKAEDLRHPEQFTGFDYLLTENATMHASTFDVLETVPEFHRLDWHTRTIVTKPRLFIMRRKRGVPEEV